MAASLDGVSDGLHTWHISGFAIPPVVLGWPLPTPVSSGIALLGVLLVATIVQFTLSYGSRIPIALYDKIPDKKKRIDQYRVDSRNVLYDGYKKFKGQIFGIDTSEGTTIVLPTHYMEELKSNPALTFFATFDTLTLPYYTSIKEISPQVLKLFTTKLNPSLGAFMPGMQSLYHGELFKAISDSKDWKPIKVYYILFDLVCKSAARSLLGEEAARNPRWVEFESEYISTAIPYIQALKKWPIVTRPFVYKHVEGYKKLRQQWAEGKAIMADYLEKIKANNWEPLQDPPSFFDHVASQFKEISIDDHLAMQITMFIAGVHTSAATCTHAMFDAAVNGDCLEELRQEIKDMHKQCGGVFTRQDLGKLLKLDSFVKEVLRFSSPDLATFMRKSSKEVVLSNGFRIPKGAKIQVATGAIGMDEEFYENPRTFDGLRFWRLRQQENQSVKHQFTSVSKQDLDWGYGRHSCPGRYMADITIKLLLVEFFLHLEIKNPVGKGRHANIEFDGQTMPDTEAEILVRRIQI